MIPVEQQTLFPEVDNGKEEEIEVEKPDPNIEKIAALEARIEEGKESEKRLQDTVSQMVSLQSMPTEEKPGDTEAPDPLTDPDGYRKHIEESVGKNVESKINDVRSENNKQNAYNQLWSKFERDHPDLMKDNLPLVRFQAQEILKEVSANGTDAGQYIIQNGDKFMGDVAERVGSMISKIKGEALDTGRTEGVIGNPSAKLPANGQKEEKKSSFVQELIKTQEASEFF